MSLDRQQIKDLEELFNINQPWMEELDGKTILITGITGFIGRSLVNAILFYNQKYRTDIRIIGYARSRDKIARLFATEWADYIPFEVLYGSIEEKIEYEGRIDYIIHCATATTSKLYVDEPVETIRCIVFGTDALLRLACEKEVRSFVYLSSMEMYGSMNREEIVGEDEAGYLNCLRVRSSYPEGKRLAECLCASYAREYGVNAKIARLSQTFGAGIPVNDNHLYTQLARSAMNRQDFVMRSDGSSFSNCCYITDTVKALLLLLTKGEKGEAYNIVKEENTMTIKETAEMVSREIADGGFRIIYDIPEEAGTFGYAPKTILRLSGEKAHKDLGWQSNVSIREMYERLIASLSERCSVSPPER